jgi:flagellar biosynthetic protein FliR
VLVMGLAALAAPLVPRPTELPTNFGELAIAFGSELILGSVIGLALAVVLVGVQLGGYLIAQEAGLTYGQVVDPSSGEDLPPLSLLYMQLATVLFLVSDGHLAMVRGVLDSFHTLPLPGDGGRSAFGIDLLLDALQVSGELAIQVAAPALVALTLANVALGFISRTVPQLNVLTVGFSLKTLVGFVLMAVSLPPVVGAVISALEGVMGQIRALLAS